MRDRRDFLKTVAGATTGMLLTGNAFAASALQGGPAAPAAPVKRREVSVAGTARESRRRACSLRDSGSVGHRQGHAPGCERRPARARTEPHGAGPYSRDRSAGSRRASAEHQRLLVLCARTATWQPKSSGFKMKSSRNGAPPMRTATWRSSSVALQFPDLAAEQLEYAVKKLGARGAAIGGHVQGEDFHCRSTIRSGPRRRNLALWFSCILRAPRMSSRKMRSREEATWAMSSEIPWKPRFSLRA